MVRNDHSAYRKVYISTGKTVIVVFPLKKTLLCDEKGEESLLMLARPRDDWNCPWIGLSRATK